MFVWCYLIIKHHTSWWRLFYYFPHFSIVRYFMMCSCRSSSSLSVSVRRPTGKYKNFHSFRWRWKSFFLYPQTGKNLWFFSLEKVVCGEKGKKKSCKIRDKVKRVSQSFPSFLCIFYFIIIVSAHFYKLPFYLKQHNCVMTFLPMKEKFIKLIVVVI